jgi:haloalkane dehalogenase
MVTPAELPDWLRRLYPFEPKALACGKVRLSYIDEGPRSDEAVLLLHGNPTWSFHFREVVRLLTAAGLRCVAPDHIGMGLSDKPQDYPYCLETHIQNLTGLVASLGLKRVHLLVHDWGGAIGFGWATRHPEIIGRIVILNTAAFHLPRIPLRIRMCRTPLIGEALLRGLNAFAWAATRMAVKRTSLASDVRRGYLFPYDSWKHRIGIARFVADIPMRPEHPTRKTLEQTASGLAQFRNHSVKIVWGGADFCFNEGFLRHWQEILPQAQTHFLPDVGHYVLEDVGKDILSEIAGFLSESAG